MDEFQRRYESHIERKKSSLETKTGTPRRYVSPMIYLSFIDLIEERRSQRTYNDRPLTKLEKNSIINAVRLSPSSCNRQAIYLKEGDKEWLDDILVGGKKWAKEADVVYLLFGDKIAYKNPAEIGFMPYLDAGFVGENIYLMAETLGLGCCYINPNIREENKQKFIDKYGDDYFCGAVALGNYDLKAFTPPTRKFDKVLRK